jgi:hypothetical protein
MEPASRKTGGREEGPVGARSRATGVARLKTAFSGPSIPDSEVGGIVLVLVVVLDLLGFCHQRRA